MPTSELTEYDTLKRHFVFKGVPVDGMEIFKGKDDLYSSKRKKGSTSVRHALRIPGGSTLCFDEDKRLIGVSGHLGRTWEPRGAS
jgi:hypothetical protein